MKILTGQAIITRYENELEVLEEEIKKLLIRGVQERLSVGRLNLLLDAIGRKVNRLNVQLEKLIKNDEITAARVKALNAIYTNSWKLLDDAFKLPTNALLVSTTRKKVAAQIANVFTVPYKNGARHNFREYLDGVVDSVISKQIAAEQFEGYLEDGVVFAMVSTEPTRCYICSPWLGTVGTIGEDRPGYPRIDNLFPIHVRCIHRIIPADVDIPHKIVESWCINAEPKEYYRRFVATPEGKEIQRQVNKDNYQRSRIAKINQIYTEL